MISEIQIENFKSIARLTLGLGHVTVLIGENGSGKSNILEGIAFAAAASANKLDDEFLYNRGIRVTEQEWMLSKFVPPESLPSDEVPRRSIRHSFAARIVGSGLAKPLQIEISPPLDIEEPNDSDWSISVGVDDEEFELESKTEEFSRLLSELERLVPSAESSETDKDVSGLAVARFLASRKKLKDLPDVSARMSLRDFMIYAPENSVLRKFETEGAIKPLGPKGEGLLKLLAMSAAAGNGKFASELKEQLSLLGWFGDLRLPSHEDEIMGRLQISDRWLSKDGPLFDQRSANEGFLYLLFYFTLLLSKQTPAFFAIDNLDASLNPKLCAELMRQIAVLAKRGGKQVICTTHNPAILDGLNLNDDDQRLYVVSRNSDGHTVANRVKAPRPRPDGETGRLSTAFLSGMLGGLPEHF
ncbi:MAG: AAA family ATPase [Verrucomicrobia bacterium]|nr:AAA family ATPase [Verrucomicrobiota bacterium]